MDINTFNIAFDMASITLSFCAVLFVILLRKSDNQWTYHLHILTFNLLSVLCNMLGIIYKGNLSAFGRFIVPAADFGEFVFVDLLSAAFALYYFDCIKKNTGRRFRRGWLFFIPHTVHFILIVVNLFVPVYYYIDANNIYHRSSMFLLAECFGLLFAAMTFVLCFVNRNSLTKSEFYAAVVYIAFPVVGLIVMAWHIGVYPLLIATSLSVSVMFCILLRGHIREYIEKRNELTEMRRRVMLSQIQPHFIYNTLGAIQELCVVDPPEAERAVGMFSKYLRRNFDSLSVHGPVPFTEEVEHIKNYVEIEKIRFGDRLNVVYDFETLDFSVPVLSVQPLVENAVKYGVTKKENGGTVTLKTEDLGSSVRLSVIDDGVGFDPKAPLSTDRSHIGLETAKKRFLLYSGATFDLKSEIGKGTAITVILPKTRRNNEDIDS